jgi:hypothetical protein
MKKCSTCRKLILFGGTKDSGYKFCNSECLNAYHLFRASPDEVREFYSEKPKFDVVHFLLGVVQVMAGALFIVAGPVCLFDSDFGPIPARVMVVIFSSAFGLGFLQAGISYLVTPKPSWLK